MADIDEILRRYSSPDAMRSPSQDLSRRHLSRDEMRSHQPAWYDSITNALTDMIYGENANTKNRATVSQFTGPENPFNVPANVTDGYGRLSSGLSNGDYRSAGLGALQMGAAFPLAAALGRASRGAPNAAAQGARATIDPLAAARQSPHWPAWGDAAPERAMAHVAEQEAFAPWDRIVRQNQWNGNLRLMDTAEAEARAMASHPELGTAYRQARSNWLAQDK